MDDKDKDLKNALDDIFGSDFIEIDTNNTPDIINENERILINEVDDTLTPSNNIIVNDDSLSYEDNTNLDHQTLSESIVENNQVSELNTLKEEVEQPTITDPLKSNYNQEIEKKKSRLDNKKIILYFIIGFVLGLILIFILVNYVFGITKVVNCSSSAEDVGYKFTDEYKITYKKNTITYLESVYTYTALNDEYKGQIEYVKEEKLPVVVNSNGMPGFTYLYETSDEYFKVSGYLDFTLIDFDKVDKMDQDLMPISYVKINSKTNYKTLKKDLEKQGYKCIPSK